MWSVGGSILAKRLPPLLTETTRYDRFDRKSSMKSRRAPPCQRKRSWERSASTNDWPLGHPGVVSSKLISCPRRQHPHRRRTPLPEPGQQDPGDLGRGHSWKHPKGEPRVAEDSWSTLRVPLTRARSGRYPASEGGVPAQPFSCGQRGESNHRGEGAFKATPYGLGSPEVRPPDREHGALPRTLPRDPWNPRHSSSI
jgi:hypothetical protein